MESWLTSVEDYLIKSLREFTKQGCADYDEQERVPRTKSHFAQVVLTCASIDWAKEVLTTTTTTTTAAAAADATTTTTTTTTAAAAAAAAAVTKLHRRTYCFD